METLTLDPPEVAESAAIPSTDSDTPPAFGEWRCTNRTYHADTSKLSHSAIEEFRASIRRYAGLFIAKTIERDEDSDALTIGTATHIAVFEPEFVDTMLAVGPNCDKRSNENKARWAAFEAGAALAGQTVLTPKQFDEVRAIADALKINPEAADLLTLAGVSELGLCWTDPEYGLPCKCRPDKLIMTHWDGPMIVDLKTTRANPEDWARECYNNGYHRQAAHYIEGVREVYGLHENPRHMLIVVNKSAPYDTVVHQLSEKFIGLGQRERSAKLEELAARRAANDWTGRMENAVNLLDPPGWTDYTE